MASRPLLAVFWCEAHLPCPPWLTHALTPPPPHTHTPSRQAGVREDNRVASRPGGRYLKGYRFFQDDEDMYQLEDILQVGGRYRARRGPCAGQGTVWQGVGASRIAPVRWRHWAGQGWLPGSGGSMQCAADSWRPGAGGGRCPRAPPPTHTRTGQHPCPQAVCFLEAGRTFVPAKPWQRDDESKWVCDPRLLTAEVQQFVQRFGSQAGEGGGAVAAAAAAGA